MHEWIRSFLVQVMACKLIPFPGLFMIYFQSDTLEHILVNHENTSKVFHTMHLEVPSANCQIFFLGLSVLNNVMYWLCIGYILYSYYIFIAGMLMLYSISYICIYRKYWLQKISPSLLHNSGMKLYIFSWIIHSKLLTHCFIVKPYGVIDVG